ncbi:hypothetical protein M9H77_19726 [Catharanthus roseus]|uniref:Uncharacterized protein n=1 Tax=Catharanthus roseus TaxID=4058 RepID=A0ACC0BB68_CATRO|nr:hypothetical protein M9H77_19726 [Catharanthus roseus]
MKEDNPPTPESFPMATSTADVAVATAAVSQPLDASLQRKHSAMLERLSNLHQSRLARKSDSDLTSNPPSNESTQSFLTQFNQLKVSIESELSRVSQTTAGPSSDPVALKSELETIAVSISDLEKFVAENSYFLPSYEVRTCLKTISDLKQSVDDVTSQVIPKKKFSFRSKKKVSITSPTQNDVEIETEKNNSCRSRPLAGIQNAGFSGILDSSPGFRGKEGEILVREVDSNSEIGEFNLSNLNGCEVRIKGCLRALFVNKLRDCKVYVGPVFGSVLIEEVEGCVFVLASHQIRIHNAKRCDFYLRVRSRPIIEDCNGVRFAPYSLRYYGIEKHLEEANLNEETGNWANVDDFKWLRAVQSPNWSVLPEHERYGMVDILD